MDVSGVNEAFGKLVIRPHQEQALEGSLNVTASKPLTISDSSSIANVPNTTEFPKSKMRARTTRVNDGSKLSGIGKTPKQPKHHQHKYGTRYSLAKKLGKASQKVDEHQKELDKEALDQVRQANVWEGLQSILKTMVEECEQREQEILDAALDGLKLGDEESERNEPGLKNSSA